MTENGEEETERMSVRLRPAEAEDVDFLTLMLLEAFNWDGEGGFDHARVLADPKLAHYVTGWPRPGDLGVIAEDAAPPGERVGAAWARLLPPDDPGYGYVAPDVPEVSLAVAPGWRGRGVGRALLTELIARAAATGLTGLSLSVEDGNRAARLYTDLGFVTVGREGDSDTMLLRL
ncbi:N-acetyltransferase [Streptomyces sp. B6B3]|uniref:GNAT family N-acetyltransferase n=1 Tax=Streptomyces sp. B6B3 TaxID=3153570 RepID=UPI00325DFD4E